MLRLSFSMYKERGIIHGKKSVANKQASNWSRDKRTCKRQRDLNIIGQCLDKVGESRYSSSPFYFCMFSKFLAKKEKCIFDCFLIFKKKVTQLQASSFPQENEFLAVSQARTSMGPTMDLQCGSHKARTLTQGYSISDF